MASSGLTLRKHVVSQHLFGRSASEAKRLTHLWGPVRTCTCHGERDPSFARRSSVPDHGPTHAPLSAWPALFLDHDRSVRAELTHAGLWEGAPGRPIGVPMGKTVEGPGQALEGAVSPQSLSKRTNTLDRPTVRVMIQSPVQLSCLWPVFCF